MGFAALNPSALRSFRPINPGPRIAAERRNMLACGLFGGALMRVEYGIDPLPFLGQHFGESSSADGRERPGNDRRNDRRKWQHGHTHSTRADGGAHSPKRAHRARLSSAAIASSISPGPISSHMRSGRISVTPARRLPNSERSAAISGIATFSPKR
jgi:hypothetical protein